MTALFTSSSTPGRRMPPHRLAGRTTRTLASLAALAAALVTVYPAGPASAVNAQHTGVVRADPANWTPHALDGTVYRILQIGNRVYAGGSFTKVRNADSSTQLSMARLVAFDATTGRLDTAFRPAVDGTVRALAASADGKSIYVGGSFSSAGGSAAANLARLDAATGASWSGFTAASLNGSVLDMRLVGARLIVGGTFQKVAGATRRALAALNAASGVADSSVNLSFDGKRTTPSGATSAVKVEALDVTPDGRRLVAIGNFSTVSGQARHQLAVIDLATDPASLSPWSTTRYQPVCSDGTPTYMRGVDFSADGKWFVIVTAGFTYPGKLCDSAARWDLGSETANKQPTWVNHTGGDTLLSVAITGTAVYVGGHQRWLDAKDTSGQNGGVSRPGVGAIDPATGRALAWNPTKERGVGTADIYATPAGLWIGSDTSTVAGEFHGKLAFFPLG